MAQENAEILAGICVTQLIREGMPVCYGGICHAFDMKTTQLIFSGPEQAIFSVAMTQMGKYYGLPVYINAGLTDSKRPDAQAGLECGVTLAMGVSAGADIFGHMGICGVDQATSLDILVMQAEIISYVESLYRTFDVTEDTLAFDVIEEIVPNGSFIDHMHTAQHFRKELWFPNMLDRNFYDMWQEHGQQSMEQRCQIRKEDLLAHHEVEPLAHEIGGEIDKIVASAKKDLPK
jgi:trimethylamine--corrinoid protein Co-methyltransferase